jgi:hypothetical protein
MWHAAAWFFGGVFVYALLIKMVKYHSLINYIHDINYRVLKLAETFESIALPGWKEQVIELIINTYPKEIRSTLKFSNWEQAMGWLIQKDREKRKK